MDYARTPEDRQYRHRYDKRSEQGEEVDAYDGVSLAVR